MGQDRNFRREIAQKIKNHKRIDIFDLKYYLEYENQKKLFESLPKNFLRDIFSNPLPKKASDLNQSKVFYQESNLKKELDWCFLRILRHKEEINEFIKLRANFELNLLNAKYNKCEDILSQIESQVCHSYWGLQARLLIAEYKSGTEGNKILLNQFSQQEIDQTIRALLYYHSLKLQSDLPYSKYDSTAEFHLKKFSLKFSKSLLDYIRFHILPFLNEPELLFENILNIDFSFSVVDTYLEIKKVLAILISCDYIDIDKEYLKDRCADLKVIQDSFWHKMSSDDRLADYFDSTSDEALKLISENRPEECLEYCAEQLNINPTLFNLYQIFVEALVLADKEVSNYLTDDTILYSILFNMHNVVKKKETYQESIEGINKLSYVFDICTFSNPLITLAFSEKLSIIPINFQKYHYLLNPSSSLFDLLFLECAKEREWFNEKRNLFNYKILVEYYLQHKKYTEAYHLLRSSEYLLTNQHYNDIYFQSWVTCKKLICQVELNFLADAVKNVVDFYFQYKRIFPFLYSSNLIQKLIDLDGNEIYESIRLPILFNIYNLSSSLIYDSIANFLIQNGIQKNSDYKNIKRINDEDTEYISYYLLNVATINNTQDSPFLQTIEDVEKERIQVLSQLKELNQDLTELVNSEIFDITQKATIRTCLQNIYDSRIYVDTNGLKNVLTKELFDYFERYIDINDFTFQDYSLYVVNQGKDNEFYSKYYTTITYFDPPIPEEEYKMRTILYGTGYLFSKNSIEVPYSRYLAFLDIFENIKNEFLFNEDFGLKFFLSMRIRHGTLPNYLKNVFERHNLIINEGISKEKIISFWTEKISAFNSESKDKFISALISFTTEIEFITMEGVSWVKIKESEHDKMSLFDISFSENDTYYLFRNRLGHIKDISILIEEIFNILWTKVNDVLTELKSRFSDKLLLDYLIAIDHLHSSVEDIYGEGTFVYFSDLLVSVKTDIQTAIQKSLNWFSVSKSKLIGEIPLSAVIQTSKEYLNILNANVFKGRIKVMENITEINIQGDFFILFCDLFNTILGNVIKHTEGLHNPYCAISVFENDFGGLTLQVKNNILVTNTEHRIDEWNMILNDREGNYDASFEEKSGFKKIKKLLASDKIFLGHSFNLSSSENFFTFEVIFKQKKFTA